MSYTVEITRNPLFSRRAGAPISRGEWRAAVLASPDFAFDELITPPDGKALWTPSRDGIVNEEGHGLWFLSDHATVAYPPDDMFPDMIHFARLLKADVVSQDGGHYDVNDAGTVIEPDDDPFPLPAPSGQARIYGAGSIRCGALFKRLDEMPELMDICYEWYLGALSMWNLSAVRNGRPPVDYPITPERMREDRIFLWSFAGHHGEVLFSDAVKVLIERQEMRQARAAKIAAGQSAS